MCARGRLFTQSEDDFLRTNCSAVSRRDMAERLDRSVRAIESRCRKLGLRKFRMRAFSTKEDRIIRSAKGRTSVEIAEVLGRSPAVVRMRAQRLGLGKWKSIKPNIRRVRGKYIRIPEHRALMEEHLGRRLSNSERVHHIDFDKRNNRIENLFLCSSDAHHRRVHSSFARLHTRIFYGSRIVFDRTEGVYLLCETDS